MPNESFISNIGLFIHYIAQGSAQDSYVMGLASGSFESRSRIATSDGDVIQEYLRRNGDVACKDLRMFCKNKTQSTMILSIKKKRIR
jgi:prephenate dehydrogenase